LTIVWLAFCVRSLFAQKLEATILYRQDSDSIYTAVIPLPDGSTPAGIVDCAADATDDACLNPSQTGVPGRPFLRVTGTTLSLLLPDGRVAVLNCLNKFSSKGTALNRRGCAMPLVKHVEADFSGRNAKLRWIFSTDHSKTESETYRIVALLDKPKT
jgi:hypothetical protein